MDPITLSVIVAAVFCAISMGLYRSGAAAAESIRPANSTPDESVVTATVSQIFGWALLVRLGLMVLIDWSGYADFFAPDRFGYDLSGRLLAESWSGGLAASPTSVAPTLRLYHYYNGMAWYLLGDFGPFAVRLLNCVAGACAVPITFRIASRIFGRETASQAAWFVALFPSIVLWSSLNIRDAWAVLALLGTVDAALMLRERVDLRGAGYLLLSLGLLGGIRGYMFLIVVAAVLLSFVPSLGKNMLRSYFAGLVVAGVFVYLYSSRGYGADLLETASLETLNMQRAGLSEGRSAFHADVDISTPGNAIKFLPIGVSYFLFAPFPWQISGARQLLALPETLAWWFLALRFIPIGISIGLKRRADLTLTVLTVTGLTLVAYGLVEGNVGTAYRHRAQLLPLLLILAAGGLVSARRKHSVPEKAVV